MPPTHGVAIARSINEIRPDEWDALADGRGLYLSYRWLAAVEGLSPSSPFYLLARDSRSQLVGALPVYPLAEPRGGLYDHSKLFEAKCNNLDSSDWYPAWLLGTRAGYQNEILVHGALDASDARRVCTSLFDHAVDLANQADIRTMALLYLTHRGIQDFQRLMSRRDPALLTAADVWLPVGCRTLDEWLNRFPSKQRITLRHERKQFLDAGHTVKYGKLSDWYERVAPLLVATQRRYGQRSTIEGTTNYLERLCRLDDLSVVILCLERDRPIAFSLLFEWQNALFGRVVGFDYDRIGGSFTYFNLTCYEPMSYGCSRSVAAIHMGIESYEAKLRRGAVVSPLWSIVVPLADGLDDWRNELQGWNSRWRDRWRRQLGGASGRLPAEFHLETEQSREPASHDGRRHMWGDGR